MSKPYNLSKLPSGVLRLQLSSECGILSKRPHHRTLIATVCFLVLASSQGVALAARQKEIQVAWSEAVGGTVGLIGEGDMLVTGLASLASKSEGCDWGPLAPEFSPVHPPAQFFGYHLGRHFDRRIT